MKVFSDRIFFEERLCTPTDLQEKIILEHHIFLAHIGGQKFGIICQNNLFLPNQVKQKSMQWQQQSIVPPARLASVRNHCAHQFHSTLFQWMCVGSQHFPWMCENKIGIFPHYKALAKD